MKKLVAALAAMLCLLCLIPICAGASYGYTVRFYAGAQGTINGEEVLVYEGLRYGERITFDMSSVQLKDESKYYARGIRESGKDNSTVGLLSFAVVQDMDYVVAYGIRGDEVAYTVRYLSTDGVRILPDQTFYGNVGDKPVVAYRFVDGYQPRFYNLTKTLVENAAENQFDFVYYRLGTAQTQLPSPSPAAPSTTPTPPPTTAPAVPTATAAPGDTVEETVEPLPETKEIEDLDNPLSNFWKQILKPDGDGKISPLALAVLLVLLATVITLFILWIMALLKKRRERRDG